MNRPASLVFFAAVAMLAACHHQGGHDLVDGSFGDLSTSTGPTLDFATASDLGGQGDMATGKCPTAVTCAQAGASCGPISDGCGGILQCGSCSANQTCGGGGTPSVCGTPCVPKTCAGLGFNCGPAGDGCGGQLDCGSCGNGQTCGGAGMPSVCGNMVTCTPKTCVDLGFNCGPAGDGCGGMLDCGSCGNGEICGGGGTASVCGKPACKPLTCASVGPATCGPIGDGCGNVIQCGDCNEPTTCGGQTASQCGVPSTCTNLCLQQTSCATPALTTTITGVVYAPNGVDPLPNVLVYVPNAPVQPFAPGVACEQCSDGVSGSPLVSAATDVNGAFTLSNAPAGSNIPLVIQTGRWRRQVTLPSVASCAQTLVDPALTRLPRNKTEGDIPLMAFVTGAVDSLECVMRKIGVDDTEFSTPSGTGRIQFYIGDGTTPGHTYGGANAGTGTPSEPALVDSASALDKYDMVLFPCQGLPFDRTNTELKNLVNYANKGGRIFATHFNYTWFYDELPFSSTADWDVDQCDPYTGTCFPPDQTGYIDQTFPKGQALAQWLFNLGASTTLGQIAINTLRWDLTGVVAPSQSWMTIDDTHIGIVPMHYTFNTPVGSPAASQCGRVLFDDFHVENQSNTTGMVFPAECDNNPMTAQEKLLEFMIFDLGSCVAPDVPTCTQTTCAAQNIGCGPAGDGCGGALDCGPCTAPATCGGGGVSGQCGAPSCTPTTCMAQGIQCGPAGDGCGNALDCGSCPAGQTCGGGGGTPGVCGSGACVPTTCMAQGIQCGPAGDGCGNALDCGSCPAGQTCGGNGMPGVCGSLCVPKTCQQLGFDCGPAGDGCGNALDCGMCSAPQTCGGGGMPNVCGGAVIQ